MLFASAAPRRRRHASGDDVAFLTAEEYDRGDPLRADTGQPAPYVFLGPHPSSTLVAGGPSIVHTHISPALARRVANPAGSGSGGRLGATGAGANRWASHDVFYGVQVDGDPHDSGLGLDSDADSDVDDSVAATTDPASRRLCRVGGNGAAISAARSLRRVWIKDFPAVYTAAARTKPRGRARAGEMSAAMARDLAGSAGRGVSLRMMVYPLTAKPFPQCHKLVLTCPSEDAFFHWTFLCTPFSFATLAREMRWDLPQMAGDAMAATFESFGRTVRDRVREFTARLHVGSAEDGAVLTFSEIVCGYRTVDLLSLSFRPSDWADVQQDVRVDFGRMKAYHDRLKSTLVQVMDTVARYQPGLLLAANLGPEVAPTVQPRRWSDTVNHLLPRSIHIDPSSASPSSQNAWNELGEAADASRRPRIMTPQERLLRKKAFVLTTMPDQYTSEAVFSKTVFVRVMTPEMQYESESYTRRLTFTFYTRGPADKPDAYYIVATSSPAVRTGDGRPASGASGSPAFGHDNDDVFFSFTSEDITAERFLEMTRHTNVATGHDSAQASAMGGDRCGHPRVRGWKAQAATANDVLQPQHRSRGRHRAREARIGFHPDEGVGGVVGIIGGDYLGGVEDEPERYYALLRIYADDQDSKAAKLRAVLRAPATKPVPKPTKAPVRVSDSIEMLFGRPRGPVTFADFGGDNTGGDSAAAPDSSPPKDGLQSSTRIPPLQTAELVFVELVMFRTSHLLTIKFTETRRELIKAQIQEKVAHLQAETSLCRARLDAVLAVVQKRNYALWTILGNIRTPRPEAFVGATTMQLQDDRSHGAPKRAITVPQAEMFAVADAAKLPADSSRLSERHAALLQKHNKTASLSRGTQQFGFPSPERLTGIQSASQPDAAHESRSRQKAHSDQAGKSASTTESQPADAELIPPRPVAPLCATRIPVQISARRGQTALEREMALCQRQRAVQQGMARNGGKPAIVTHKTGRATSAWRAADADPPWTNAKSPFASLAPDQIENGDWTARGFSTVHKQ
ncbi:hypothetical protein HK105_204455 [Polyrhizophydium stewartii]|uniref:Uncharacterized protein n=1 Tax=Polyrhizophydium stewartii TaxID=2732419 RepID=A0ABR4N917_9FUNG